MPNFVCVGLDIREKAKGCAYSADATVWKQHDNLYQIAKNKLSVAENFLQLLQPKNEKDVRLLWDLVRRHENAELVSLEISLEDLEINPYSEMIYPSMNDVVRAVDWIAFGLDVCDINGFFSFFHMKLDYEEERCLLPGHAWEKALELAKSADGEIPSHAPFVVVRVQICR